MPLFPGEEHPLGLILCAEKRQEHVGLLELDKSGIHVAQYLTQLPSREILEEKLKRAIKIVREKYNDTLLDVAARSYPDKGAPPQIMMNNGEKYYDNFD